MRRGVAIFAFPCTGPRNSQVSSQREPGLHANDPCVWTGFIQESGETQTEELGCAAGALPEPYQQRGGAQARLTALSSCA